MTRVALIKYNRKRLIQAIKDKAAEQEKLWKEKHEADRLDALEQCTKIATDSVQATNLLKRKQAVNLDRWSYSNIHWDPDDKFNSSTYDRLIRQLELSDEETITLSERASDAYFKFL